MKKSPSLCISLGILALCLFFGLCGCASPISYGMQAAARKLSPDQIAQIKKGVTTEDGVKTILGSTPDGEVALPDGSRIMLYSYIEPGGNGLNAATLGLFGSTPASDMTKWKTLKVEINTNGIVENYSTILPYSAPYPANQPTGATEEKK